jgi:hypothetical protein
MKISTLFPRKYATGADLVDKTPTLIIDVVQLEEMHSQPGAPAERKPVIYFQKATKGIVLTPTLARQIAAILGDETETWSGKSIQLYAESMRVAGQQRQAIRARRAPNGPTETPASLQDGEEE